MRERDGKREARRAAEPIRRVAPGEAEPGTAGLLWLQRAAGNAAVVAAMAAEGEGPSVQRVAVRDVLRSSGRPLEGPVREEVRVSDPTAPPSSSAGQVQRASEEDAGLRQTLTIRARPGGDEPSTKRRRVAESSSSESDSSAELDSTEWPASPDRTARPGAAPLEQAQQRDERARGRILPWLLEEQVLADYLDYRALAVLSGMERFLPASQRGPGDDANATPLPAEHGEPSARELRQLISAKVRERLLGVTDETMAGVLRIMASHGAPGRVLGDDPVQSGEGGQATGGLRRSAHDLLPEMLKHVGYRQYAAQQGSEMMLEEYGDLVLQHAQMTALLGSLPPEVQFPVRDVDRAVHQAVQEHLNMWVADTRRLHGDTPNSARQPQDNTALDLLDLIQPQGSGGGHHFSVVDIGPTKKAVYTNRPLKASEIGTVEAYFDAKGQQCQFHYHHDEARSSWGPERGAERHQRYDKKYPFHSELQQTLDKEPWEIHEYTGNSYRGCAQCMKAFQALGVPTSLHGEAHGRKFTSVIPPRIRTNTVYLRHYLGTEVWAEWEGVLSQAWWRLEASPDTAAGAGEGSPASTAEHVPLDDAEREVLVRGLASLKNRIEALQAAGQGDQGWKSWLSGKEEEHEDLDLLLSWKDAGDIAGVGVLTTSATELRRSLEQQGAVLDLALFFEFLATVERVHTGYEKKTAHPDKKQGYVN